MEIRKSPALSPFVTISDLVDFIIEDSARLMKSTSNDYLYVYPPMFISLKSFGDVQ